MPITTSQPSGIGKKRLLGGLFTAGFESTASDVEKSLGWEVGSEVDAEEVGTMLPALLFVWKDGRTREGPLTNAIPL